MWEALERDKNGFYPLKAPEWMNYVWIALLGFALLKSLL